MWTTEHTAVSPLPRPRVWRAVRDLHTGDLTYPGADRFELHGDFAVGTVKSRLSRGRGHLAERLARAGEGMSPQLAAGAQRGGSHA